MKKDKSLVDRRVFPVKRLAFGITFLLVMSLLPWNVSTATGPLADTPWPVYAQNAQHNGRSPYQGPQQMPVRRWNFVRNLDHWGTDYRGTGIGMNNTVYLAAGMAGVYAIDSRSGQMKWLFSPENTGHETWVEFPPTVAADGTLYITSENDYLYALDTNGKVLWKFRSAHLHTPVSISPDGTTIHFVSESGYIYALNRADGTLKWRYQLAPYSVYGTGRRIPVSYDASGNLYFGWGSTVWSLTAGGQKRWALPVTSGGSYLIGPAVSGDDTLYFTSGASVAAVTMSGQLKWQQYLNSSAFDRTPAVGSDGTVYIGGDSGWVYAFNPDGTLKWRQQYVLAAAWAGGVKSNISLDGRDTLYFLGRDGYVYAVSSQTRQVLWRYYTGQIDISYPGLQISLDADGTLYVPVNVSVMIALGPSTPLPAAPTLLSPSNGATVSTVRPTLDWSDVSGATKYQLAWSKSPTFASTDGTRDNLTTSSFTLDVDLAFNTQYYWRVKATGAGGDSPWSSIFGFKTPNGPPGLPTLLSPVNGANSTSPLQRLDWTDSTNATSYQVQLSTDSTFGATLIDSTVTTSELTPTSPLASNTYYWRVKAVNTLGNSGWTTTWSFIVPAPPDPVTLLSPTDGETLATLTPTLTWGDVANANSYQVQYSTDNAFASNVTSANATSSTYTIASNLLPDVDYYWQVRALNGGGAGPWSEARRFHTPTTPPVTALLSNGGFEDDVNGDGLADNWPVTSPGGPLVSRSGSQHYEGSFSLRANSTGSESFAIYQDVPVNPGEGYSFSGWMNVPTATGWFRASIQLLALDSSGRALTTVTARSQSAKTTGWVPATTSLTIPAGATTLRVQLTLEQLKADVYVDSFSLTRTK